MGLMRCRYDLLASECTTAALNEVAVLGRLVGPVHIQIEIAGGGEFSDTDPERGELEANNSAYSTLGVSKPDWKRDGKVRYLMQFGVERIGPPCAHGRILKIDDRLAKLLFGLARFRVALPMARLPFGHGPRSQKPSSSHPYSGGNQDKSD